MVNNLQKSFSVKENAAGDGNAFHKIPPCGFDVFWKPWNEKAAHRQRETGAAVDNMNGCRSMYQKKGIKKPFKLSLNGDKPFPEPPYP